MILKFNGEIKIRLLQTAMFTEQHKVLYLFLVVA